MNNRSQRPTINQKLSIYNVKTFKTFHIKKIKKDVDIDTSILNDVNKVFCQSVIKRNEKTLLKEFNEAMENANNQRLSQATFERELYDKEKPFRDFVDKFVKVS